MTRGSIEDSSTIDRNCVHSLEDLEADAASLLLQQRNLIGDLLAGVVIACGKGVKWQPKTATAARARTVAVAVLDDRLEQRNLLVDAADAPVRPALQAVTAADLFEDGGADVCARPRVSLLRRERASALDAPRICAASLMGRSK